ncbi:hypothetical protein D3C72_1890020 [compost metagenome]
MAVEVKHFALEAGEGDDVQFAQVEPAFLVVVGFFAQGWRQALQQLLGTDAPWPRLAAYQLAQGKGAASALQLLAPFIIEPTAFVENEKHLEGRVTKQYIRRLLASRAEVFAAVRNVQALQQALADPTLTFPFTGIGKKRIGLFGLNG